MSPIFVIMIAVIIGCAAHDSNVGIPEVDEVVFMAGYKPQANLPFVGVYVADTNGYFEDQGLRVDIKHASAGEHVKLLLAGDVQFSTSDAGSVMKQVSSSGAPIIAIALIGQKGQQGYMSLATSNINTLEDWEGKTLGYKISLPSDYLAMIEAENVVRAQIKEVSVGFDPRILTEGKVDILAVFKSNEPDTIRSLGFDVKVWDPFEYGVPTLGLTYITTVDYSENNPDIVRRFLKATLRGIQFAIDNPDSALDIVEEFAPGSNREHQAFMLETEIKDARSSYTDNKGIGVMSDDQWKSLYEHLLEYEALDKPFEYRDSFNSKFVDSIYDSGSLP